MNTPTTRSSGPLIRLEPQPPSPLVQRIQHSALVRRTHETTHVLRLFNPAAARGLGLLIGAALLASLPTGGNASHLTQTTTFTNLVHTSVVLAINDLLTLFITTVILVLSTAGMISIAIGAFRGRRRLRNYDRVLARRAAQRRANTHGQPWYPRGWGPSQSSAE